MLKRRGKLWCLVYGLFDPRDASKEIRYIGQTRNTKVRLFYHLKGTQVDKNALGKWKRELVAAGVQPQVVVLDQDAVWNVSEIIQIERAKTSGSRLLNILRGGDDVFNRGKRPVKAHPDFHPA
jgi:hypothetical protein